jgi:Domain of unknown function (DUF4389)
MADYPVTFDVAKPEKFERPQVFIRIIGYIVLGFVNYLIILGLPIYAAFNLSKGSERFHQENGPTVTGWLRWYIGLYAYVMVCTDKFPMSGEDAPIKFDVQPQGNHTLGSALLRFITSIPSGLVLAALATVGGIIWLIASIMILIQEDYPEGLYDFQRGITRWAARLVAYHASLVQQYPPFSFDMGPEGAAPAATGGTV